MIKQLSKTFTKVKVGDKLITTLYHGQNKIELSGIRITDDSLSVLNLTSSGFDVTYTKATDEESADSTLVYKLYANTNLQSMDTVTEIEANGSLQDQGTDVSTLSVSGIGEGEDVDFNVIVEDPDGNKRAYKANNIVIPDETSPTVSTSTLDTNTILDHSFNVTASQATDNVDFQDELEYILYTSTTNNLTTDSATVEANGTEQDSDFGYNFSGDIELTATGLTAATTYYYNIVVEDTSGNKSIYTSNSKATTGTPTDSTAPTPPADDSLSTSSVTGSGLLVDFNKATDDVSAQSTLVYKLYTSSTNNLDTDPSTVIANGALESQGTDVTTLSISGLSEDETIWFNVVVEDEAGNQAIYTQNSETTLDTTDPTVTDGSLGTNNVGSGSFKTTFTKATDNVSAQTALVYKLYTSITNNVDTVSNAEANGTLQQTATDVSELLATGLNTDTLYYFNVVVEDEAGNKTAYTMNSQTTATLSSVEYNMDFELQKITL